MIYGFRRAAAPLLAAGVTLSLAIVSGCSYSGPVHASYVRDGHKVEVEVPGQAAVLAACTLTTPDGAAQPALYIQICVLALSTWTTCGVPAARASPDTQPHDARAAWI